MRRLLPAAGAVGLVALLAALPLLRVSVPGVLPGPTYTPGTLQLLALALLVGALALTYDLLFGFAGLLSFGHALFFAAGVYVLGITLTRWQWTLLPAVGVTLLAGLVLAVFVGAVSLRVGGIAFAMVTLAFAQAGSVLTYRNPGGLTGGEEGLGLDTTYLPASLVGVANTRNLYWLALALLVVVYAVVTWVTGSRAGRVLQAVRENERRVQVLGLQPYTVKLLAFVVAGALASLLGMAYLLLQGGASPHVTTPEFTLALLVMVVLGGAGRRWGAVLGGVVYTLLDQRLSTLAASPLVADLPAPLRAPLSQPLFLLGTLFVLVVLFLPGGLARVVRRGGRREGGAA